MLLIDNHNITDPAVNLALEEYCYRHLDPSREYVLFYINQPSIVIGNHQNPFQEINSGLAAQKQIQTIRRISGGGAVYHDTGNLNFSFITDFGEEKLDYFKKLLQPVIETLKRLGVPAELADKNDIIVNGQKISGNSQHANMRRMLSHGTLLFDAELDTLRQVLKPGLQIVESRAVASIPSSVTNISGYLYPPMEMAAFMGELADGIAQIFGKMGNYRLTAADWDAVHRLAEDKYRVWEWNIGRAPEFTVSHKIKLGSADVGVRIRVKKAVIDEVKIEGRQAVAAQMIQIQNTLIGQRYDPSTLGLW
jgi:lipoate-protein ligase A